MIRFTPTNTTRFVTYEPNDTVAHTNRALTCPGCKQTTLKPPSHRWVSACPTCKHLVWWFVPLGVQQLILQLQHRVVVNIGGVGCGKTTASALLVAQLMWDEPGVKVYAMAPTLNQLQRTGMEELDRFFIPTAFAKRNKDEWRLPNGSAIHWYTADDAIKLRGVNAGLIWLIEASGIPEAIFVQAMARLRQDSLKTWRQNEDGTQTLVQDKVQLILESNPHLGWVRDAVLKSHTVVYTKKVMGVDTLKRVAKPTVDPETRQPMDIVAVLQTSLENPYMSAEFFASQRANAPDTTVADRQLYCDLSFQEGLVFGTQLAEDRFVCPVDEAHQWYTNGTNSFWVEGIDPGGPQAHNDPTGYIIAVYTDNGEGQLPLVKIVRVWKQSGVTLDVVAKQIWHIRKEVGWSSANSYFFAADPSSVKQNWYGQSWVGDLARYDVHVTTKVNRDIAFGIRRIQLLANHNRLLIPDYCTQLWQEIRSYRWGTKVSRELTSSRFSQKPVDKDNHLIDPLRYIVANLNIQRQMGDVTVLPDVTPSPPRRNIFDPRYEVKSRRPCSKRRDPYHFLG